MCVDGCTSECASWNSLVFHSLEFIRITAGRGKTNRRSSWSSVPQHTSSSECWVLELWSCG